MGCATLYDWILTSEPMPNRQDCANHQAGYEGARKIGGHPQNERMFGHGILDQHDKPIPGKKGGLDPISYGWFVSQVSGFPGEEIQEILVQEATGDKGGDRCKAHVEPIFPEWFVDSTLTDIQHKTMSINSSSNGWNRATRNIP